MNDALTILLWMLVGAVGLWILSIITIFVTTICIEIYYDRDMKKRIKKSKIKGKMR